MAGVYRQGSGYMCDVTVGGARIRKLFSTKQEAEAHAEHLRQSAAGAAVNFIEFAEIIVNGQKDLRPKNTWKSYQSSLSSIKKFFDKNTRLSSVTNDDIARYVQRRKLSVKNASINRELAFISKLYNIAIGQGLCIENPVREWRSTLKLKGSRSPLPESRGRLRYLTVEEAARFVEAASDPLRGMIEVALYTGMRMDEVFGLQWEHVDSSGKSIYLMRKWKQDWATIPMNGYARSAIERQPKGSIYVFPGKGGSRRTSCRRSFNRAKADAGLGSDVTFHTLRHTFASHAIMNGMPLKVLQEILGHASLTMTMRYAHLSDSHTSRSMSDVASSFAKQMQVNAKSRQQQES